MIHKHEKQALSGATAIRYLDFSESQTNRKN
jgi:hypothetical protein